MKRFNFRLCNFDFVAAAAVRRAVVPDGDIREDIAFQNDINILLARLDGGKSPLQALGWVREPVDDPGLATTDRDPATEHSLRVIRGGGMRANVATSPTPRAVSAARRA